jgi:hypothetical protein
MADGRDVPDATFACPDLATFTRLDELGLEVIGQRLEPDCAVLACRVVDPGDSAGWCRRRGREGAPHDSVTRRLAHEPFGWRPTTLLVTVRRYRCTGCGHVWRQGTSRAAEPRAKLSRRGLRWALEGIVVQHLTVARVADGLGVSWNTANDAVLAEGRRVLIVDPGRFDGVAVVGVDEHVWRHTRRGERELFRRGRPCDSDDDIDKAVNARMERQQILDGNPPMLLAVIDEDVLRRRIGGHVVMREQLAHLLEMAERPKVVLQVVPFGAGAHPGLEGPFVIASFNATQDVAYLDSPVAAQLIQSPEDVSYVALLYDTLRAEALPRGASIEMITEVMGTWT